MCRLILHNATWCLFFTAPLHNANLWVLFKQKDMYNSLGEWLITGPSEKYSSAGLACCTLAKQ